MFLVTEQGSRGKCTSSACCWLLFFVLLLCSTAVVSCCCCCWCLLVYVATYGKLDILLAHSAQKLQSVHALLIDVCWTSSWLVHDRVTPLPFIFKMSSIKNHNTAPMLFFIDLFLVLGRDPPPPQSSPSPLSRYSTQPTVIHASFFITSQNMGRLYEKSYTEMFLFSRYSKVGVDISLFLPQNMWHFIYCVHYPDDRFLFTFFRFPFSFFFGCDCCPGHPLL